MRATGVNYGVDSLAVGTVLGAMRYDLTPGRALTALAAALIALSAFDARKARVVELRFFGGLSSEETASVLEVSADTVRRDWKVARAWLLRELSSDGSLS